MAIAVDLGKMSTADKLQLMEDLWRDLASGPAEIGSPAWHGEVLAERERLTASGEEKFIDWEVAKKQLHEGLP
jgi:hypothetical protein